MITSNFIDSLSSLETHTSPEKIMSLKTHYTRRHWHPFGQELLNLLYCYPDVDFGKVITSIIDALTIDLDSFIICKLIGKRF